MAIPISTGDLIEIVNWCTLGDQAAANVCHYQWLETTPGATLEELAEAYRAEVDAVYADVLTDEATFDGSTAKRLAPTATATVLSTGAAVNGTAGSAALPAQSSGLITKRTGSPGPSGRGRIYPPFPDEADNEVDGTPTSDYVARLLTLAGVLFQEIALIAGSGTGALGPILLKRSDLSFLDISGATARRNWATQRRRGGFGARNVSPFS